jgi:hypothetical protein
MLRMMGRLGRGTTEGNTMHHNSYGARFLCHVLLAAWIALVATRPAAAQTAIPGRPFGVGSVRLPLSAQTSATFWQTQAFEIDERDGRILYPVFRGGLAAGGFEAEEDELQVPARLTVSFLFTGDGPLQLTVRAPEPQVLSIVPRAEPARQYRRALNQWWRDYHAVIRQQQRVGDYPSLPHLYLSSMLGQRLGLRPPLLTRVAERDSSELQQTLELLLGDESRRDALARELMAGGPAGGLQAELPVTGELVWPSPAVTGAPAPEVEAIARHVPAECFYLRFGSFPNYLWFSRLMRDLGGELGRLASLRGHDARLNERLQKQLALKETKLAEIFGSQLIADVAILGRDLYLADGAATGILFQARNSPALTANLQQQRTAALEAERDSGAQLEEIELAGRTVSFLSTPDNRLRSFYAVDDDFHLVTTSQAIVERFFAAGAGEGALADAPDFRRARQSVPVEEELAIFAFFSPTFFQELVSPAYQVELRRRLEARVALDLVQLAQWAARAEGLPGGSLAELISSGLLPDGFGRLADGSGPILESERLFDSLRGGSGTFKPIPDVPVQSLTQSEAESIRRTTEYFQGQWREFDPLLVTVRREARGDAGRELLKIDANISPLAEEKYGWILSLLGPPSTHWVPPGPGDVISMQALVTGGRLASSIDAHHLFLALRDAPPELDLRPTGVLNVLRLFRTTPSYLGSWPKLGFLDWLPLGQTGWVDAAGFSQLPLGLWRWQGDGFSVLSFQPEVLESVVPQLRVEPTDNAAQIRVQVADLSQSRLAGWINVLNYQRARQASLGNARLLHMLSQQFRLSRSSAREEAERLIESQLVCALGGKYQLAEHAGVSVWQSDAWPGADGEPPAAYQAPLLNWFRGLRLDVTKLPGRLVMHAEVEMQRAAEESPFDLPFFNLFEK